MVENGIDVLKLLAIDIREGWAFIEEGDRVVLTRPPYRSEDARISSTATLCRAVQDHDFESKEMEFVDRDALISFVRSQVVDYAKSQGRSSDANIGDELIAVAPRIFIEELVDIRARSDSVSFSAHEYGSRTQQARSRSVVESFEGRIMSDTICGHERESLHRALKTKATFETGWRPFTMGGRISPNESYNEALTAIDDPDKLAEIIAQLIRENPKEDVVVIAPNRSLHRTPSRLDWVVYWDRNHGGTIQVKPPCGPNDPDTSKLLAMPQARALASKLLDNPTEQDIERMLSVF
jgi:hypothetical protein